MGLEGLGLKERFRGRRHFAANASVHEVGFVRCTALSGNNEEAPIAWTSNHGPPTFPASASSFVPRNGANRIEKCLAAVRRQSLGHVLQLIVVDDGSTDNSAEVATVYGAEVIRHAANRGPAAARNTGIAAARAPIIATLDDDCEPEPEWAERLLGGFVDGVVGVGGAAVPVSNGGYFGGYLERNNPLAPLEIDLASSTHVAYRFARYLLR